MAEYVIEMLNITKVFLGSRPMTTSPCSFGPRDSCAAGGERRGKSTLMSVLFGLYQPEEGVIKKKWPGGSDPNPNDATALHIGMVHQHFKLVECFSVLTTSSWARRTVTWASCRKKKKKAREKVLALSQRYNLKIDPDAKISNISVGMQQRVEILEDALPGQ